MTEETEHAPSEDPKAPFQGASVVIVEDFATTQEKLKRIYENLGMDVLCSFKNGLEAFEWICEQPKAPDFVSLDIIMPVMNGTECYDQLRAKGIASKCFFVSCLASEEQFVDSMSKHYPREIFIPKNFDPDFFSIRLGAISRLAEA